MLQQRFARLPLGGRRAGAKPCSAAELHTQLVPPPGDSPLTSRRDILQKHWHSLRTINERYARIHAMKTEHAI